MRTFNLYTVSLDLRGMAEVNLAASNKTEAIAKAKEIFTSNPAGHTFVTTIESVFAKQRTVTTADDKPVVFTDFAGNVIDEV